MAEYYGLNPNLAGAGASAPTYTLQDYPLSLEKKRSLPLWLDSLTRVTLQNTPDFHDRGCTCCNYPNNHQPFTDYSLASLERIENWLLKLPCGCSYRRGCVVEILKDRDSCHYCGFEFFKQWSLQGFVKDLPTADLVKERERGRDVECGICQRELSDQHVYPEGRPGFTLERPIKLPCSHVYGEDCLRQWLSPASKGGGNANTCPSCRKVLFPPWPSDHRDDLADVGLSDDDDDDSDGSSISSWDDSTVLGERDNAPSGPATSGMRPPMPSIEEDDDDEEEEEDIAPAHVEIRTRRPYAMRGEHIAPSQETTPAQVETRTSRPYAMRGEDIAPSHATTRTRGPRDSTASDEVDIAPSYVVARTRRPYASGGERIAPSPPADGTRLTRPSRTVSEVTTNLRDRLPLGRSAASGEDNTTVGAHNLRVRRPIRQSAASGEDNSTSSNATMSVPIPNHRHLQPLRRHLNLPTERERLLRMEERLWWGVFITNYAEVQQLNRTQTEESTHFMEETMLNIDRLYDDWCDESPEEQSIRRDEMKEYVYQHLGTPRLSRMERLDAMMQDFEDEGEE